MNPSLPKLLRTLAVASLLAGPGVVASVMAAELPGGGQVQEYFVRQHTDEDLLIRIDGREAQYQAEVFDQEGELLKISTVPGSRLAPLFQFIRGADRDRQLDIRITAPLVTDRSRFDLGLNRFTVHDQRGARLLEAWEWLAFGLELPAADTAANWSIRVNALAQASDRFRSYGMDEFELWALWYTGHLTLLELGDNHTALQLADELLARPAARRFARVRLAALSLRANALLALRRAGESLPAASVEDPVQAAAAALVAEAAAQREDYERAEALFLSGQDHAELGRSDAALGQLNDALSLADAIGARDLATRIREQLVSIHGAQGDVAATSEVLQAIGSQLAEKGAEDELAQNLLAQGRILNATYRFGEARALLAQALAFEHNSATRAQLRLALAEAAWAEGDLAEAWAQARAAVVDPDGGGWRRRTPVLDSASGLSILAGVARERRDFGAMREARTAQGTAVQGSEERIRWTFERALDEVAAGRGGVAAPLFAEIRDSARGPAVAPLRELAVLWLCRLGSDCSAGAAEQAHRSLQALGVPRHAVTGGWLYAAYQSRSGQQGAAADTLEQVVAEMSFLHYGLPGVLEDVLWRLSPELGEDLPAALRASASAERQLLGLARLRWLRAAASPAVLPFDPEGSGLDTEDVRALLARAEAPEAGDDPARLAREVASSLERGRADFTARTAFLSPAGLETWLSALEPGEAVLDIDRSGSEAVALVGTRSGVNRVSLGPVSRLDGWDGLLAGPGADEGAFDALARRLGDALLSPLDGRLPRRVYLADADGLAAMPWEALVGARRDAGRAREFIRLSAFPAHPGPAARLAEAPGGGVFLAGRPADHTPGYLARLESGAELGAVMDRFVGPGLQVIQGAALLPDEFSTSAFNEAGLVHLAMPATIRLDRPGASRLELSEARPGEGRGALGPGDLARWRLSASLLVLSQATITTDEDGAMPGAGRPPLVAEALSAGAGTVLATAWPGEDETTATFMAQFYERLQAGDSLPVALDAARDAAGAPGGAGRDPARYQLWVE